MSEPSKDPSIQNEPHWRGGGFEGDPSEPAAAENISQAQGQEGDDDRVEHTVWDEPGLSPDLAGPAPEHALTYWRWLEKRIQETGVGYSWAVTVGIALVAGPWALLGSLIGGERSWFGVVMAIVFGPVLEEMMKVAIPLWVVEKRPFLFRSRWQIGICVLVSGLVFAAVENVLYLQVYTAEPSALLIQWRWSVCVALHMGCSFVGGLGLMRIWTETVTRRTQPRIALSVVYLSTAMVIHGLYNTIAVLIAYLDYQI